jgi:hypothetical protein
VTASKRPPYEVRRAETCGLQKPHIQPNAPSILPERGWLNKKVSMMKKVTLAVVTAAAIAASAVVPTSFAYAAPATPHYKPLICMALPTLDVCNPPKPVVHHHHAMKPVKKPMKPMKPMKPTKPKKP